MWCACVCVCVCVCVPRHAAFALCLLSKHKPIFLQCSQPCTAYCLQCSRKRHILLMVRGIYDMNPGCCLHQLMQLQVCQMLQHLQKVGLTVLICQMHRLILRRQLCANLTMKHGAQLPSLRSGTHTSQTAASLCREGKQV